MVNRKFAREGIYSGKNLKNTKRYDNPIYINNSFCREFGFLNYAIRKAKGSRIIHSYKVKNGVNHVRMEELSKWVEIGHVADLENLGIPLPPRRRRESQTD